jgi:hypothetical protein
MQTLSGEPSDYGNINEIRKDAPPKKSKKKTRAQSRIMVVYCGGGFVVVLYCGVVVKEKFQRII